MNKLNTIISNIKIYIPILSRESKTQLGRWNLDYFKDKLDTKIDLANEDHCGICSEYSKKKIEESVKDK